MCYADLVDHTPEQIASIAKVIALRFSQDKALQRNHSSQPPTAPGSSRLVSPDLAVGGNTIEASSC